MSRWLAQAFLTLYWIIDFSFYVETLHLILLQVFKALKLAERQRVNAYGRNAIRCDT